MSEIDYYSPKMAEAKEIAEKLTNFLNNFNYEESSAYFNEAMSRQHRTLQQNFMRLVMGWVEHVASDKYGVDGRNVDSQKLAERIIDAFKKYNEADYRGFGDLANKPSKWLGTV